MRSGFIELSQVLTQAQAKTPMNQQFIQTPESQISWLWQTTNVFKLISASFMKIIQAVPTCFFHQHLLCFSQDKMITLESKTCSVTKSWPRFFVLKQQICKRADTCFIIQKTMLENNRNHHLFFNYPQYFREGWSALSLM